MITPEMRAAFEADGVVKVPGAVDGDWVERESVRRHLEAQDIIDP